MAKLYFKIASDWEEVVRLRNEIAKLKQELKGMDSTQSPAAFKSLNTQLSASTQRMDELVNKAAQAGAVMEGDFRRKIFDASQTVNGFTEKIIAQKNAIGSLQTSIRKNKELYRTITSRGNEDKGLLNHIREQEKALGKERDVLFNLTQAQANARLSVKRLRDEYSLYKNDGKQVVETNQNIGLSLGKALGVIGGVAALKQLGSEIIRVRGEFQSMQTAIETMVGKDMAGQLIPQIKELAKISPLTMSDMVGAEKMMLGFNIQAEDTIKYLKAISDISMGESGKFNSLTLAFSQMSAAGKLMGQDLNQMINAGFNPLQVIAEKTGKSIAALKEEMSKGALSAEMVQQAFIDATSAGGKFFGMSENASKTINGQISMMQDALDNAFNEMGQKSEEVIMKGIQMTTSLIENYEAVGKVLTGLIVTYGTYRTAIMLVTAAESKHTLVEIGLINARVLARKAQLALNAAMLTNPYVLLATAVVGLGAAMWAFRDSTTAAEKGIEKYNKEQEKASKLEGERKQKVDSLIQSSRDIALTDLQRGQSLAELRKEYPKIFAQYDIETIKLTEILNLKQQIAEEDTRRASEKEKDNYEAANKAVIEYSNSLSAKQVLGGKVTQQELNKLKELETYRDQFLVKRGKGISEQFISSLKDVDISEFDRYISELENKIKGQGENGKIKLQLPIDVKGSLSDEAIYVVKDIKTLIDTAKSTKQTRIEDEKNKTTYREDLAIAKADWEKAKKGYEALLKDQKATSEQVKNARDDMQAKEKAYKDLGGVTSSFSTKQDKQTDNLRQEQEKYKLLVSKQELERIRQQQDLENQVSQSKIDAMEDGFEKEQAQRELNNKLEIQSIQRQKEDYIQAAIKAQKDLFDAQEELKAKQNKGYIKKSFDPSSVSVDTSAFDTIISNTSKRQQNDKVRSQEEAWNEYLLKFGNYQQKRQAIIEKYDKQIKEAGPAGDAAILEKNKQNALDELDNSVMNSTTLMGQLFADASQKSVGEIQKIIDRAELLMDYLTGTKDEEGNITIGGVAYNDASITKTVGISGNTLQNLQSSPEEVEALTNAIRNLKSELGAKSPFKLFETQIEDAVKKIKSGGKDSMAQGITDIGNAIVSFSPAIKQFGSDLASIFGEELNGDIANVIDGVSGLGQTAAGIGQIMSGDIVGGVMGVVGGISQVVNAMGSLFGPDGTAYYEGIKEQLEAINSVYDKIIDKSKEDIVFGGGFSSIEAASTALDNYEKKLLNLQKIADASGRAGASWKSHSAEWHSNKNVGAGDFGQMSRILGKSIKTMDDLYYLTGEELYLVMSQMPEAWSRIDGRIRENLESIVDCKDEANELKDALNEAMTGIDQDSFYNGFIDQLSDMDTSFEDMCDNFEGYLRKSIIAGLIASQYKTRIDGLYEQWSEAAKSDKEITEDESDILRQKYKEIIEDMIKDREQMAKDFGWDSSSSSQSATSKSFQSMSQDTGEEISGRLTAVYEGELRLENQSVIQTQSLNLLTAKADTILSVNTEVKNIADETRTILANSYLELVQISENTGNSAKYLKDIKADIAEVKKNTSKL